MATSMDVEAKEAGLPWVEKYRPASLDDVVSQDNIVQTRETAAIPPSPLPPTLGALTTPRRPSLPLPQWRKSLAVEKQRTALRPTFDGVFVLSAAAAAAVCA